MHCIPYYLNTLHIDRTLSYMDNHLPIVMLSPLTNTQHLVEYYMICSYCIVSAIFLRSATPVSHTEDYITVWKDAKLRTMAGQSATTIDMHPIGRPECCQATAVTSLTGLSIYYCRWSERTINYHKQSVNP